MQDSKILDNEDSKDEGFITEYLGLVTHPLLVLVAIFGLPSLTAKMSAELSCNSTTHSTKKLAALLLSPFALTFGMAFFTFTIFSLMALFKNIISILFILPTLIFESIFCDELEFTTFLFTEGMLSTSVFDIHTFFAAAFDHSIIGGTLLLYFIPHVLSELFLGMYKISFTYPFFLFLSRIQNIKKDAVKKHICKKYSLDESCIKNHSASLSAEAFVDDTKLSERYDRKITKENIWRY